MGFRILYDYLVSSRIQLRQIFLRSISSHRIYASNVEKNMHRWYVHDVVFGTHLSLKKAVDNCVRQCIPNFCMRHRIINLEICNQVCGNICIDSKSNGMFSVHSDGKHMMNCIYSVLGLIVLDSKGRMDYDIYCSKNQHQHNNGPRFCSLQNMTPQLLK